ncbi:hypothetical protein JOL79_30215 [Microbispora sp. RL4-1S]|uniref:DUF2231 domain-containing protein n=1 Tax=Microbispora oryzae TaxID=2806554 RepID=A0A940WM77_9ACTN|nr:DUF2231 domain-containing protein [Microbispora oryzae]MBP2708061.1 hypothetical protein [Microbispora oryzae]
MFDQVFGLPAHPLLVHAAVVFAPLLAVLAIAYVALPRFRHKLDWALVLCALAAPVSVFAAKESGEALEHRMFGGNVPEAVEFHSQFADVLLPITAILTVAALALVYLTRSRRGPDGAGPAPRAVTVLVSVASVVLAVAVGYYIVRTGDAGARAVWAG